MLTIGLTGGLGSGKSTVAALFEERGVSIIDADKLSRVVVQPDKPAYEAIVERYGQEVCLPNHHLDRAKLRNLIFNQPNERLWLEGLLHPKIRAAIVADIPKQTGPYCIVVIPLLVETLPYPFLERILVVDVDPELQIERVMARDECSHSKAVQIISTQASREHRLNYANDVITNNGDLAELTTQVQKLHERYLKLAAAKK